MPDAKPVNIFIAYAHADEAFLRPLRKHLAVLEDDGVSIWYDGEILPGEEWDASIKTRLKAADIILLLVSIDFLTSDYVKGTELPTALSRHAAGECTVVPVIVRNCLWQKKLGALQALPKEAFPVENWSSVDNAYHNVVGGLDRVIEKIKKQRIAAKQTRIAEIQRKKEAKERAEKEKQEKEKEEMRKEEIARRTATTIANLMVLVKGGTFEMGSNRYEERPIHHVSIPDFYLCKYPVTQGQWKHIMGNNPSHFKGEDSLPVENVSWYDAQKFIYEINRLTQNHYRLSSESEWEYACRGGSQSKGFRFAGGNSLSKVAWYSENSKGTTHPVGQKKPNELDLYDMNGNVWEWCEDMWHGDYGDDTWKAPDDGSPWTANDWQDIKGHVLRGGSWLNKSLGFFYVSSRSFSYIPFDKCIGFRLAHDYPM